jgi:hypothetical protein
MAAGLGYKEFTTGDILTAADANGYLASQVVMVFASATARTTAITSPQEGMISYLKDTNSTEYYSGSAWAAIGGGGAGGKVLQVVQGTTSTATATTSGSYVASNLSVTITPSASTSKVLVMYSMCNLINRSGTYQDYQLALYRGATQVWVVGNGNFGDVPSAVYAQNFDSGNYLDSPATTSATTYTMYGKRTVGTLTMNEQGVANQGTLIALEIGA